ncbi:MFS domain-containing protein [Mycena chlorophos]|uniref:MFS domain-containing protein n=1 Tax=Mycena chlorophos TaxID=658473 RepID=A0A8H6W7X8_MYCCL|nr:MFS domain-containing protein [Mycena chlorophos]
MAEPITSEPRPSASPTLEDAPSSGEVQEKPKATPKTRAFYLTFLAISVTTFLSAIDLTAVGTALPTISDSLHDTKGEFTWVGNAYALSSTAFIPLSGNLADAFGRRGIVLFSITFFAIGSALSGAAQNMNMLIAARTVQGIGGGGILALSEILIADLVPLAERGIYQGFLAVIWSLASSIGPPIGGALANVNHKAWRWLFFLNLPLCGLSFFLVLFFLRVRSPPGSVREKLAQVDWIGNTIIIFGSSLAIIGLTWGGIRYPWGDAHVLAPLIIGLVLIAVFGIYDARLSPSSGVRPTVPSDIISNRTSLAGLIGTSIHGLVSIALIYYLPVYFQAVFTASPIRSAVDFLPSGLLTAPFAFVAGVITTVMAKYRPVNYAAWCFVIIGFGIFTLLDADSSKGRWVGFQVLTSVGLGMLFSCPVFPILAPLPPQRAASALALWTFARSFFQAWGITIASTVLQNKLKTTLPPSFIAQVSGSTSSGGGYEIAYAAIPLIRGLDEPLKRQVQVAFAESMKEIWQVMTGISGIGLLSCLLMREIPMGVVVDETYALHHGEEGEGKKDGEKV